MRWRPACWQRHVDAHPARSMTMITLLPSAVTGRPRRAPERQNGGCGAHCCAQLGASQAAACPETPVRAWRSEGAGAASPVPRGPNDSRHAAARSQRGHGAAARAARCCPPPHRARSGRGVEKRPGCVHRRCVKKGYKLWGRRPSVSTVQPLGHYYPRAITHTRAGASVDTQHRIAVHFITPTPNTHTNLEVLPWVMVSPEYRRAAVHMRTKAQLDTRSAAAATSHHTHRAGLPNAERPSVSQYVSDGRDCRLTTHMHMRSPAERRGGEGASARVAHTRLQRRTDANG